MIHTFEIEVGFAVARPPSAANTRHRIAEVAAESEAEAHALAALLITASAQAVMPVSTRTLSVEV